MRRENARGKLIVNHTAEGKLSSRCERVSDGGEQVRCTVENHRASITNHRS